MPRCSGRWLWRRRSGLRLRCAYRRETKGEGHESQTDRNKTVSAPSTGPAPLWPWPWRRNGAPNAGQCFPNNAGRAYRVNARAADVTPSQSTVATDAAFALTAVPAPPSRRRKACLSRRLSRTFRRRRRCWGKWPPAFAAGQEKRTSAWGRTATEARSAGWPARGSAAALCLPSSLIRPLSLQPNVNVPLSTKVRRGKAWDLLLLEWSGVLPTRLVCWPWLMNWAFFFFHFHSQCQEKHDVFTNYLAYCALRCRASNMRRCKSGNSRHL